MSGLNTPRRIGWKGMLGIILVPVTIAGLFFWGLWSPTERLRTVEAAVVNLDQPVTLDGQITPLGRVFAGALIGESSVQDDDTNFTWYLTNADDAKTGLDDGRYSTVVTIPKNFSAAATSGGDPATAEQATIDIATSDRGRLIDSALSNVVTSTATRVLNEQLGTGFIDNVFVGLGTLSVSLGEAADGAVQLADGSKQLATGAQSLADGTQQLSTGAGALATGASGIATGTGTLAGGVSGVASGIGQYVNGTTALAGGARQVADGTASYVAGIDQAVVGVGSGLTAIGGALDGIAQGISAQQINEVTRLPEGVVDPADEITVLGAKLIEIQGRLDANDVEGAKRKLIEAQALQGTLKTNSAATIESFKSTIVANQAIGPQLTGLAAQIVIINDNLGQITAGGPLVLGGVNGIADGLATLAAGGAPLASGANTLAGGANELASGVNTFSSGMSQFAAGTPALAEGATKLAEGADGAATGTESLADGLGQAAEGVPNYSESERETLARSALTPVVATGNGDELFNAAGVPLFTGIALWAGGLATFLILSPLWRRTRTAARGLSAITLRSAFPGILAGAAQGALVGIAMPLALDLDGAQFTGFLSLGIVTGIAFALLNQGLAALLGGFGRFVSFIVLVVAFAGGIVSTAPEALRTIGDATPIGAAFSGFQSIASGASGAGSSATMLVLWGLIGLALTAFAAARARKTGRAPVGDTADAASVTDQSLLPV